jgi:sensor c-di-GMP phosphodiesterase-like protein
MRQRFSLALFIAATVALLVLPPWLASREAWRQAYEAEALQTLSYARDVLHRTENTSMQVARGIKRLQRSGYPPCSEESREIMRQIDLASSYIQAIGLVRNGVIVCSSMGDIQMPLGKTVYQDATGTLVYPNVPMNSPDQSPLLAVESEGYAALIHRDLPIDASTSVPGVSLAVMHMKPAHVMIARGAVDPAWLARLGEHRETSFEDQAHVVAIVRSHDGVHAALAAVPIASLAQREADIARRLVPAGLLIGVAGAIGLFLFVRERRSMGKVLKSALRRNELFLLYQPIIDLQSGDVVGAEALLRWRRPTGELISPEIFIPVAEQSKLITQFTERVLHLVAEDAGSFLATHPDFHIAINLSAADLCSPAICTQLDAMLERCGALPSNLLVEITERGFLHIDRAREVLAALRERCIDVAIDDFGTGYSSLSYLQALDLDYLKIDRAFTETIGTDAPTSDVVHHIIGIARTMELKMIAEGIDSPAQVAYLRRHGVEFGQGWLFGKPVPFADIARKFEEQSLAMA